MTRARIWTVAVTVAAGTVMALLPASAAIATAVNVYIGPKNPVVGDHLVVHGKASGAATGTDLTVSRSDPGGPYGDVMTKTTDADGHFSYTDPRPAVEGQVMYTVAWGTVGENFGSASATVRRASTVRIFAEKRIVTWEHRARLTAHLGGPATGTLTIYARPHGGSRKAIRTAAVDASGNVHAAPLLRKRTTYTARFSGDAQYAPDTAQVVIRPRAVLYERLHGGYGSSHGYRLYHPSGVPTLSAHMHPELDDVCLWFRAERWYFGAWHKVAVGCIRTDADGRASGSFTGDAHHLNSPYRVRAIWAGSRLAARRGGHWYKLKFR